MKATSATNATSLLYADCELHARTGAIAAAKIESIPGKGKYSVGFALRLADGQLQPVQLASARKLVREFGSVDSAVAVVHSLPGEIECRVV